MVVRTRLSIIQNKTISSNFVGALFQIGYDWAKLGFAYDNIWGAQSAYGQGELLHHIM